MKILFYCPFKFNINSLKKNKLGGIESLNFELAIRLAKIYKFKIFLATATNKKIINKYIINIPIKLLKKKNYQFDIVISSNDPKIFNIFPYSKKIFWMHNTLAIEKAIRKKFFFPLLLNKITVIFVSKFLQNITTNFFFFNRKIIIPNFLLSYFSVNTKINYSRKNIFIWAVQRETGIDQVIEVWKNKISLKNPGAELHIFGIKKNRFNKFKKDNIFYHGRVEKKVLIKFYKKSLAMICLGYDETFCLNAIEGMSCGLPIITFGYTSLGEISLNNYNSFKINSFDELDEIINKIINLNYYSKKKIIDNCINFVKRFHIDNIIKYWQSALNI